MPKGRNSPPTPGIIISNVTPNVVLRRDIQPPGVSGGGSMAVARFSGSGFSRPSYSPGPRVRR